jgi:hypothetical protein
MFEVQCSMFPLPTMNDLRYAFRQLLKHPGYTTVAVLTLALGIGANTAIFQLLNAVRSKSLPVSRPQELIEVRIIGGNPGLGISDGVNAEMTYPLWEQLQKHPESFSGMFAWSTGNLPIGSGVETRIVRSLWTSEEFFSVLGVAPFRGRLFNAEDDRRGAGPGGVVLSHAFWQSEFGGQDSAIEKSITLGDQVFQIIGVTPPAFFGLEVGRRFDVAVPISTRALWWDNVLDRRDAWWLRVMGRLKPGATLAEATGHLKTISPGIIEDTVPTGYGPGARETYRKFRLSAFRAGTGVSQLRDEYVKSLWLLSFITLTRRNELGIRLALGARRGTSMAQFKILYLFSIRSAAVLGSSNVSTPKTTGTLPNLALAHTRCARRRAHSAKHVRPRWHSVRAAQTPHKASNNGLRREANGHASRARRFLRAVARGFDGRIEQWKAGGQLRSWSGVRTTFPARA